MKYVKMLGLAAVAAAAIMAFVGVGSASATELCKEKVSPCPAGSLYGAGTAIEGTSTNPTLTSSLGNVVCTHSLITGETTTAGGSKVNVEGTIKNVSFTGCSLTTPFGGGTHTCTVTPINTPWKAVAAKGATLGNGTMTASSGGTGEPGAKVDCGASVLRCQFTSASIVLDVTGGSPASILAKEEPLNRTVYEGGLCPSTSSWDATYTVIKPNPLFIV